MQLDISTNFVKIYKLHSNGPIVLVICQTTPIASLEVDL
jgi:hypothetical protein